MMDQVNRNVTPYSLAVIYTVPVDDTSDLLSYDDRSTDLQSPHVDDNSTGM
jgi:hypothetical protein